MSKPTREQIEAWWASVGPSLHNDIAHIAELAYAAGRKAGMEEAVRECEAHEQNAVAHSEEERYMAHVLAQAIRAAMEVDSAPPFTVDVADLMCEQIAARL